MMTNQAIDGVPRELLRRMAGFVPDYTCAQLDEDEAALRALLDAPSGWRPCSPELLESGVDCATAPRWSSKDWDGHSHWHPAPAAQPQGEPVADSTTSDKYKAELYDEVWELARDMGFGNVTDALMKLKRPTAPVAVVPSDLAHDIGYRNGVMHGYQIAAEDSDEEYRKCVNRLTTQINTARRESKLEISAETPASTK